jgi:Holliday junction resolvase-like predicted endonuclease
MIKVKAISVREKEELEPLLVANPEIIEDGLKIIAHQHPTDSGPLDILAVDSDGTLVVVELKNEAAEDHLDQGLRYYDWCRRNISWIASAYSGKANINMDATPRLMLVAPAFTETVKRIDKYIDAELDLIEYHAFENEKKERGLICTAIDYGQAPMPPEIPTIEKKMEYFQSDKVRELFRSVLEELAAKQVEIKPIHELWISF